MTESKQIIQTEHQTKTADDVPLHIYRVQTAGQSPHATPIVFIHGSYTKRNFWVTDKMIGLAPHLARAGFDCWVPELRGHGKSPKTDRYRYWTADDHIRLDLPAIAAFVFAQTKAKQLCWIGHSAGGLFIAAALSAGYLDQAKTKALVFGGCQIEMGDNYLRIPGAGWIFKKILRIMGTFNASRFGMGPESEPAGEMIEYINWKYKGTRWHSPDGFDYLKGLSKISLPILSFGAAADKNDPAEGCEKFLEHFDGSDKTYELLGKETGFSHDFGHADIFASKNASREVWPVVEQWLRERM